MFLFFVFEDRRIICRVNSRELDDLNYWKRIYNFEGNVLVCRYFLKYLCR